MTLPEQPRQACANQCGREMDMTRAVWWTAYGPVCTELCARQITEERESDG